MWPIDCGWVIIASCSTLKKTLSWCEESGTERVFMSKTLPKELSRTIREKREQLVAIRDEVEDLIDYLEVIRPGLVIKRNPASHTPRW